MEGKELIKLVVDYSGLPNAWAERRLLEVLEARNIDAANVSLDELREVLAEMLQDLIFDAQA